MSVVAPCPLLSLHRRLCLFCVAVCYSPSLRRPTLSLPDVDWTPLNRSRSLLDAKITSILSWCCDHTVLFPVQRIILSTILYEDTSQQPLSFLQSESGLYISRPDWASLLVSFSMYGLRRLWVLLLLLLLLLQLLLSSLTSQFFQRNYWLGLVIQK